MIRLRSAEQEPSPKPLLVALLLVFGLLGLPIALTATPAESQSERRGRVTSGVRRERAEASGQSVRVESTSGGQGAGRNGAGRRSAPRWRDCVDFGLPFAEVVDAGAWVRDHELMRWMIQPRGGGTHWRECARVADGGLVRWVVDPAATSGPVAAELVAHQALGEVELEVPDVVTSPLRGMPTMLVGVPVWFWVPGAVPVSVTAEVPGLSATLTASPVGFRGTATPLGERGVEESFECEGTGEQWVSGVHGPWEASDCSITFDWNDTYQVDATVVWALTWVASNGESGSLPDVERTSSFTIRVWEAQAVTD